MFCDFFQTEQEGRVRSRKLETILEILMIARNENNVGTAVFRTEVFSRTCPCFRSQGEKGE